MKSLKQTQETFWQLIQEPEGIQEAANKLSQVIPAPFIHLHEYVHGRNEKDRIERMEIYSNMYFARIVEILQEDYPAIYSIIGAKKFHSLCVDYLQKHPSKYYDLALVSQHMPAFIQEHPINKDMSYLSDLSKIEWHKLEVLYEANANPCHLDELKKINPEKWGELEFQTIPALRMHSYKWDLMTFWTKFLENSQPPSAELIQSIEEEQNMIIWRKNFNANYLCVAKQEKELLTKLKQKTKFEDICDLISEQTNDDPTQLAGSYLLKWLENELITQE